MKKETLGRLAVWITENRLKTLFATLAITVIMLVGAANIKMEMSFFSILPSHTQKFKDLKTIMDSFPFASNITVILDAKNINDPEKAKEALIKTVNEITTELNKDSEYIASIMGTMDMDFVKNHGLMLAKSKDIERTIDLYKEGGLLPFIRNLNNDFEKEYSGNEDNLKNDEQTASSQFKNIGRILELLNSSVTGEQPSNQIIEDVISDYLYGEEYFFNKDYSQAAMYVLPSFLVDDVNNLVPGVNYIEKVVKDIAGRNGITGGLTGLATVSRDEMTTSSNGFLLSMTLAVLLILTLLIIIFKMRSVPIIIGVPLLIGIIWTVGVTGFVINRLNLVSAMYMIALIGLGVDYAIHIMTNFVIEKENGLSFKDALEITYIDTGKGIITGALTTAVAFLALLVSETQMLKELGFIATLIIIPLLLSYREKNFKKDDKKQLKVTVKASIASGFGGIVTKYYKVIILVALGTTILLSLKVKDVGVQSNLMEMEAKGLKSIILQDQMVEEFEMAPDVLSVLSSSLVETKMLTEKLKKLSSVKSVDSIAPYLPSTEEHDRRGPLLDEFRNILTNRVVEDIDSLLLLDELYRLEANLLELSETSFMSNMEKMTNSLNEVTGFNNDGEKFKQSIFDKLFETLENGDENLSMTNSFQKMFEDILVEKLLKMSNTDEITVDMLPENIKTG